MAESGDPGIPLIDSAGETSQDHMPSGAPASAKTASGDSAATTKARATATATAGGSGVTTNENESQLKAVESRRSGAGAGDEPTRTTTGGGMNNDGSHALLVGSERSRDVVDAVGDSLKNKEVNTKGEGSASELSSLRTSSSSTMLPDLSLEERMRVDRLDVIKFLKSHSCYDFIPDSGKVVVLDVRISMKLAFVALVEHELTYAPLWSETDFNHVGMLTSTDLIQILEYGYKNNSISQMFTMPIGKWLALSDQLYHSNSSKGKQKKGDGRQQQTGDNNNSAVAIEGGARDLDSPRAEPLSKGMRDQKLAGTTARPGETQPSVQRTASSHGCIKVNAECSLYTAVEALLVNRKQRICVIDHTDSSTLLHVLTNHRLLLYLVRSFTRHVSRDHPVLGLSIKAAKVGCHNASKVITVRNTAPLIEVLQAMVRGSVSSVPVIAGDGRVVDIYSRQDAMYLTRVKKLSTAHLNATVVEVLRAQCLMLDREGLHTCSSESTLGEVIQRMASERAHRLVCVDTEQHCVGLISVSDVYRYFLC